ncbi:ABC transporter ATP-binding protein [Bariatricus massiliensis]|uniref:ABC transporter ATP-binding protein n=1 Tax=Bariatricus massiliensis TaxID=1745713 RepID=A0ABS8DG24_9FIRM|nr:ABC transporter ATP-binding protein [Bariatricus massiliensis]MCB7304268.1 ABC transporter ATP-binding protein [Bariatricus massiliensis]MCB7374919.1 ABC transporter ATP-binding protein [Bariatricus massiliensis]MCB7387378.1 ABC transporter ATP-binding protein [Bariatricus massiliensis]MCB7411540.1 ABC transporter ATP-binding protein [Bariatricus massiliensis]MCQ5253675.1 ABC transporter ATP-binding protein [Bariatricus massiliensis]
MLLSIDNLQVRYGKQVALHIDRPFVIEEGERIGIIGSNGAGKTTLVKSILGLTDYKGSIHTELKREQMAVHMQQNEYVNTMPVKVIMETILDTSIKNNKALQELISYFEFEKCLYKRFSHLSGGQKQRLTIIMVMLQNAPLTFYDEVTSGLDFETRQRLMEKLVNWYKDKENSLCIVSHYYEELEMMADKILLLEQGHIVDFGSKEELFRKYCGRSIFIIDNTEKNRALVSGIEKLEAPEHLLALPSGDVESEHRIAGLLVDADVNFKRSSSDIEIMSTNAKKIFKGQRGGAEYEN